MEQVKYDLQVLNFILALKTLDFQPKYERSADGVITASTNAGIITWGSGRTIESACGDLMSALRAWSEIYFENFETWYKTKPEEFPYVLKVMLSNDEELAECLKCALLKERS